MRQLHFKKKSKTKNKKTKKEEEEEEDICWGGQTTPSATSFGFFLFYKKNM
jgi:hypothetical protein